LLLLRLSELIRGGLLLLPFQVDLLLMGQFNDKS
jgi:hypothetical protein